MWIKVLLRREGFFAILTFDWPVWWFYRLWQHTCELTDVKLLSFPVWIDLLIPQSKKRTIHVYFPPSIRGWRDPRSLICLFWTCGLALSSHICTYLDNASVRIGEILESEMELNNSHDKYSAAVKNQVGRVPKEYRGSFISSWMILENLKQNALKVGSMQGKEKVSKSL